MRVRSFELALDLVSAGLGVCVVPTLTALAGAELRAGISLYQINFEPRRIVAMVPWQYLRVPLYARFLTALQSMGQSIALPAVGQLPPVLAKGAPGLVSVLEEHLTMARIDRALAATGLRCVKQRFVRLRHDAVMGRRFYFLGGDCHGLENPEDRRSRCRHGNQHVRLRKAEVTPLPAAAHRMRPC